MQRNNYQFVRRLFTNDRSVYCDFNDEMFSNVAGIIFLNILWPSFKENVFLSIDEIFIPSQPEQKVN